MGQVIPFKRSGSEDMTHLDPKLHESPHVEEETVLSPAVKIALSLSDALPWVIAIASLSEIARVLFI